MGDLYRDRYMEGLVPGDPPGLQSRQRSGYAELQHHSDTERSWMALTRMMQRFHIFDVPPRRMKIFSSWCELAKREVLVPPEGGLWPIILHRSKRRRAVIEAGIRQTWALLSYLTPDDVGGQSGCPKQIQPEHAKMSSAIFTSSANLAGWVFALGAA